MRGELTGSPRAISATLARMAAMLPEAEEYEFAGGLPADVVEYRLGRLLDAGFPVALATVLADLRDVDLHHARGLLERGCPPDLAGRILL